MARLAPQKANSSLHARMAHARDLVEAVMRLVSGGPVHRTVTSCPPPNKVTLRNQFEPDMDLVTYLRRTPVAGEVPQ